MIFIKEEKSNLFPGGESLNIAFKYSPTLVDAIKSLNCAVYDSKTKTWNAPIINLSAVIDKLCKYDDIKLDILPDDTKDVHTDKIYDLMSYKTTPYPYQIEGIEYGLNHDCWLLLDAPGLGKTLQIIYLAQELKKRDNIEHCFIICGVNTLKTNWKKEIQKHSDLSCKILGERTNKKGVTVIGGVKDRLENLSKPIDEFFVITNIETLRDDDILKALKKNKPNRFDMVVVDEFHVCKSSQSQQGKNILKFTNAKYRIGLTGTLLLNDPVDAFVPLKWIGAESCNLTNFKNFYYRFGGPFNYEVIGYKNMDFLKEVISNNSLRRTKDLLDLPEKTIIHESVDMNDKQAVFYQQIKAGVKEAADKIDLNTTSVLSLVSRLRQATACPSILTTEKISSSKIERAIDLTRQIISNNEKVVIFSVFKESLSILQKELADLNPLLCTGDIKDNIISDNIDKFQNSSENKVMLATIQKMGTGVTLTAANNAIFLDSGWTSAINQQCEDRIHRIGSNKHVIIYYLETAGTVDEHVAEIVFDKKAISDFIIDDVVNDNTINSLRKYILEL